MEEDLWIYIHFPDVPWFYKKLSEITKEVFYWQLSGKGSQIRILFWKIAKNCW